MNPNTKSIIQKVDENLSFEQLRERAGLLLKSGFLPSHIKTAEQAIAIVMTGRELGLGLMESLRSISVVNGTPCIKASLLLGLCQATGQVEIAEVKKETEGECIFVLKRKGQPGYECHFTIDDARNLGLAVRDNWKKQPKTMLKWRAISAACRVVFPDAISGIYTEEEIADEVIVGLDKRGEVQVTDVLPVKREEAPAPSVEGAAGLDNPLEIDKLGAYMPKPPYNTHAADRCIMEIYGETTPAGKPKGKLFLQTIAKYSKDPEERAIVGKFLEVIERAEAAKEY